MLLHKVDSRDSGWIIVGRFGRPRGIKGFISVVSFTEPRDNILSYKHWHANIDGHWQPIKLVHTEVHNNVILAQVEGHQDREIAQQLTNIDIAIKQDELPQLPPGDYYWHELIGMDVVNQQRVLLGSVKEIMPTGANDVLVVVGEKKRHLVPYLPGKFVIEISDRQRVITVDWDAEF